MSSLETRVTSLSIFIFILCILFTLFVYIDIFNLHMCLVYLTFGGLGAIESPRRFDSSRYRLEVSSRYRLEVSSRYRLEVSFRYRLEVSSSSRLGDNLELLGPITYVSSIYRVFI